MGLNFIDCEAQFFFGQGHHCSSFQVGAQHSRSPITPKSLTAIVQGYTSHAKGDGQNSSHCFECIGATIAAAAKTPEA
jgi:hypothetical protein